MTSKIFYLVSQLITKSDAKEFKSELNPIFKRYFGRELNPSNLNEILSLLLGAESSNVLSSMIGKNSVDAIMNSYVAMLSAHATTEGERKSIQRTCVIPVLEFYIKKHRVVIGCELFNDPENGVSADLYVTCPDIDEELQGDVLTDFAMGGGDTISGMLRTVFTSSEPMLFDLFSEYGATNKPSKVSISKIVEKVFGFKRANFNGFATFADMESYLTTVLLMIAGDLNTRLAVKGKGMAISQEDLFTYLLSKK
ncbi:MAG: hypothetical protein AB3N14_20795 [Flavobacteriaceae bacterium]